MRSAGVRPRARAATYLSWIGSYSTMTSGTTTWGRSLTSRPAGRGSSRRRQARPALIWSRLMPLRRANGASWGGEAVRVPPGPPGVGAGREDPPLVRELLGETGVTARRVGHRVHLRVAVAVVAPVTGAVFRRLLCVLRPVVTIL